MFCDLEICESEDKVKNNCHVRQSAWKVVVWKMLKNKLQLLSQMFSQLDLWIISIGLWNVSLRFYNDKLDVILRLTGNFFIYQL